MSNVRDRYICFCVYYILLYHAKVPQGFPDGGFFLGRAVGNDRVFFLGEVIVLAGGEAQLAFGLGDLEAGDTEAEGVQNVSLDLLVGSFGLGGSEIGVLQIEGHADGHVRIFSDQLNNRLKCYFFVPTPTGRSDRGGADRRGLCADRRGDRGNL